MRRVHESDGGVELCRPRRRNERQRRVTPRMWSRNRLRMRRRDVTLLPVLPTKWQGHDVRGKDALDGREGGQQHSVQHPGFGGYLLVRHQNANLPPIHHLIPINSLLPGRLLRVPVSGTVCVRSFLYLHRHRASRRELTSSHHGIQSIYRCERCRQTYVLGVLRRSAVSRALGRLSRNRERDYLHGHWTVQISVFYMPARRIEAMVTLMYDHRREGWRVEDLFCGY